MFEIMQSRRNVEEKKNTFKRQLSQTAQSLKSREAMLLHLSYAFCSSSLGTDLIKSTCKSFSKKKSQFTTLLDKRNIPILHCRLVILLYCKNCYKIIHLQIFHQIFKNYIIISLFWARVQQYFLDYIVSILIRN